MNDTTLINKLTETSEFKNLQEVGMLIHESQRKFDLLTVFNELIDEMAWSKLFAYLLDSNQNHGLGQSAFRVLMQQLPELMSFSKSLPKEEGTRITCITEWSTESSRRLDILLKITDQKGKIKAVVGIENKVDSGEQNDQIRDYQNSLCFSFQNISKLLIYLTPEGILAQTSDENKKCPCVSVSYRVLSNVCEQLLLNSKGQGELFLEILKNHIDKLTNNQKMEKEISELVKELYFDKENRLAIKLINQYTPNVKNVFDEIETRIMASNNLPFSLNNIFFKYHPEKSNTPKEFKIYIPELYNIGNKNGFHGLYMLHSEQTKPDIDDFFSLRLMVGFYDKRYNTYDKQAHRNKTLSMFKLPESFGTNKHWWNWTCVWTSESYKLVDLGKKDVEGLYKLLINGINATFDEYKEGLKKLARIKL